MRAYWAILKRELFTMFVTPLAWVVIVVFLFLQGIHFYILLNHFAGQPEVSADQGPVQAFFGETIFLFLTLLVLCPALTMRSFAEERRSGTIESLLTTPVSAASVVLAKFTGAFMTYVAMWAPTVLYMVVIRQSGYVDWKVVGAGYLGVLSIGASYLSVGLLMSAMTKSQLMALAMSTLVTVGLFIVGIGEFVLPKGMLHDVCMHISFWTQMSEFSKGIIDLRRIVFDASLTVVPLYTATKVVQSWRW